MHPTKKTEGQRTAILEEMGTITRMRIGSISEQRQRTKLADGTIRQNGPYTVLTYKGPNGKTKTERILPEDEERIRSEVENHRRFKALAAEYVKACDEAARTDDAKAQLSRRSKKNGRSR